MTKCISADCQQPAIPNNAFCPHHRNQMDEAEKETLKAATKVIGRELRQFERLMYIEPPLTVEEMAHRLVWSEKEVRKMLRKFKDHRA